MSKDLVDEAVAVLRKLPEEMQSVAARAIIDAAAMLDDAVLT